MENGHLMMIMMMPAFLYTSFGGLLLINDLGCSSRGVSFTIHPLNHRNLNTESKKW